MIIRNIPFLTIAFLFFANEEKNCNGFAGYCAISQYRQVRYNTAHENYIVTVTEYTKKAGGEEYVR